MITDDRKTTVEIGGESYDLVLTTKATKEIAARYGGLEKLGDKLMKAENFEMALDEAVWLVTLLANQGIAIHNIKNRDDRKPLFSVEEVEILSSPGDLAEYRGAITEALIRGTKRNVRSEETESKNTTAG